MSVKSHENGMDYPHVHQQFECSVDVKELPTVSYPLNLYDCCPISDGACAVLVASENCAEKFTSDPIRHAGWGALDRILPAGDDLALTNFPATKQASSQAYERASVDPTDIDVAEVHDLLLDHGTRHVREPRLLCRRRGRAIR